MPLGITGKQEKRKEFETREWYIKIRSAKPKSPIRLHQTRISHLLNDLKRRKNCVEDEMMQC